MLFGRNVSRRSAVASALMFGTVLLTGVTIPAITASATQNADPDETFSVDEIVSAGRGVFGSASKGLATVVADLFRRYGEPTAYIAGEEGSGAFVGGVRYGKGTIHYKNGLKQPIFWQGPSIGLDYGANGSRTFTLIYNSTSVEELYHRFTGVEGSAYMVAGLSVTVQEHDDVVIAPIRTGVGVRLGANVGYVKYSARRDWNPF